MDHRGQFGDPEPARPRVVWDAPVRVTHATFIACVVGAWLTRDASQADAHAAFGYVALAALAFRVAWGFAGSRHARFASFAYSPREAMGYLAEALRGRPRHYTGHNPAGSYAVWVLIALLAWTIASGIVSSGAVHGLGPLGGHVSFEAGRLAHRLHEWGAWAIAGFAVFHVAGVAWGSRVHRENLARAMVTGRKLDHDPRGEPTPVRGLLAGAIAATFAVGAAFYLGWHVPRDVDARIALEQSRRAAEAAQPWVKECGECHLAYTPGLLPARSWERMLDEQDRHFGEDLSLSPAALARLRSAITPPSTWAQWRSSRTVPAGEAPQRITELRWWRHAHEDVDPRHFKPPFAHGPHECDACHRDAGSGIFHPRMIQHPKSRSTP